MEPENTVEETATVGTGEETPPGTPTGETPTGETPTGETPPKGDGVSRRINELTRKRRDAEREAAYWRGVAESSARSTPPNEEPKPGLKRVDFDSDEEYISALAKQIREEVRGEWEAEREKERKEKTKRQLQETLSKSREKYEDFDDVALSPNVPISQEMYDAAVGDNMGDILYYLGQHSSEASRIASLPPLAQAKEIGKIEVKITSKSPKTTNAPNPPAKVGGGGNPPPKPESKMSRAELHAKWERERLQSLGVQPPGK